MLFKRMLFFLSLTIMLVGCFRQSNDTFDTVESQNASGTTLTQEAITAAPTSNITIIDPNATDVDDTDTADSATTVTATVRIIQPTTTPKATSAATEADDNASAQSANTDDSDSLPTATEPIFVTPDIVEVNEQETATPTTVRTQTPLRATPTGIADNNAETTASGDCDYTVQGGDNLFRIAINNDVALDQLLAANGLSEGSIIQPGDILVIPNCDDSSDSDEQTTNTDTTDDNVQVLDACDYEIKSGDTLFNIALANNVSLADLLTANNLTENAIIQPGEILQLPNCVASEAAVPQAESQTVEVTPEATAAPTPQIHVVTGDDTLLSIARAYNVTVNEILAINTIPNPTSLTVGQEITIPTPTPIDN